MARRYYTICSFEGKLECTMSCAHLNHTAQVSVYSTEENLCVCFPGLVATVPETTDGAREVIVVELKAPGYYKFEWKNFLGKYKTKRITSIIILCYIRVIKKKTTEKTYHCDLSHNSKYFTIKNNYLKNVIRVAILASKVSKYTAAYILRHKL